MLLFIQKQSVLMYQERFTICDVVCHSPAVLAREKGRVRRDVPDEEKA